MKISAAVYLRLKTCLLICLVGAAMALSGCAASSPQTPVASAPPGTTTCEYPASGTPARPVDPPNGSDVPNTGETQAVINTNEGPVGITLDRQHAPCTVNSFISLAKQGYFNDTRCHRMIDVGIFILQCGDPTETGTGGPGYRFADEINGTETYGPGTVAMANAGPGTNGSQFFLVWADSPLPPNYTVFGQMDESGLQVVNRIAAEGRMDDGSDRPNNEALISSVTVAS